MTLNSDLFLTCRSKCIFECCMFLIALLTDLIFEVLIEDKKRLVNQIANRKPGLEKMKYKKWIFSYELLLTYTNLKSNINQITFFISYPVGPFSNSVANLLPSLTPENFCKLDFLHSDWTVSTGALRQGVLSVSQFSND